MNKASRYWLIAVLMSLAPVLMVSIDGDKISYNGIGSFFPLVSVYYAIVFGLMFVLYKSVVNNLLKLLFVSATTILLILGYVANIDTYTQLTAYLPVGFALLLILVHAPLTRR